MYAIMYQEATESFEVVEGTKSNLSRGDGIIEGDLALVEEFMHAYNNWLLKGLVEMKKCPQCGKFFILGRAERGWFDYKGLQHPKRCHFCRAAGANPKANKPKKTDDRYFIRGEDRKWKAVSLEEFRTEAMKHQPHGCSCAIYDDVDCCYGCSVSGDACLFLRPNAKLCAEKYQEGPLALK